MSIISQSIRRSRGFTIVELMVVIAVSGILIGLLFGPLNDLYTSNTQSTKSIIQTADTKGALRNIENSITLSTNFLNALPGDVTDPTGTVWSWVGNPESATSRVLITSNYATAGTSTGSSDRTIVYESTCKEPLLNYNIYFVSDGTLYRRTIQNPATSTCNSAVITQQTTCPTCSAKDAVILRNVTNFTIDYYANATDTAALANQYDPTLGVIVPTNAKSILITLTAKGGTRPTDPTSTTKLRITRVNGATS